MRIVARVMAVLLPSLVLALAAWAAPVPGSAAAGGDQAVSEVSLVIFNRPVVDFRASFLGASPKSRAARARIVIEDALRQGGTLAVTVRPERDMRVVMINDRLAFGVTPEDCDPLQQETPETVARAAAGRLEQVIAETREARDTESRIKALGASGVATLVFVLLLWGLRRLRGSLAGILTKTAESKAQHLKIGNTQIIEGQHLIPLLRRLMLTVYWLVILLLSYEWLSFVLSSFPYSRPWGERLNDYLLNVAEGLLGSIVEAIPGIGVALAIFLLARVFIGFLGRLFERVVQNTDGEISWLSPETMPTTRRLVSIGIWLFAVAMAYPYLPGAQTDAFKGLSVLLGLMVSLGASSVVGQGAAGLILTYTRTIRAGEYVRVGEYEGTVVEMGMFTTRIRTGLGEELTLPNSLITGSVTTNYSRAVQGLGYIVDTTVTIGYDTPWRQVEAMLIEAALRTPGILATPSPVVFQTALSDYYPEYRVVAQAVPSLPRPRAVVLTMLHANIQDVFNEHGVQIMSPHYMGDPAAAKVVNPADWYAAPATRPD